MATIVNSSKYGEGHEVILRKVSSSREKELKRFGYIPEKSVFKITLKKSLRLDNVFDIGNGNDSITLIDSNGKVFLIKGKSNSINDIFNHYSKNAKSVTGLLTEIKETYSLVVFKSYFENKKILSEEEAIQSVLKSIPKAKEYLSTLYYTSAMKQLDAFKSGYVKKKGYHYERQGGKLTKKLYENARKLTGKSNDNWNPADVWMIHKSFDMNPLYEARTSSEFNFLLSEAFRKGDVIPISLKQVQSNKAKVSIIDPPKLLKEKIDLDFSFDKIDVSNTFNNASIFTKCGYVVRAGYKGSGNSLNVSLEGSFKNVNYQLGAIDAKIYKNVLREEYQYNTRSTTVSKLQYTVAKKEFKQICEKYPRFSVSMKSFDEAMSIFDSGEKLLKDRFSNIASYIYSLLIIPKNFEDHMKFTYLLAKKITKDSGVYLLISE